MTVSIGEVGELLAGAGRLTLRPLCVATTDRVPDDAIPITAIDRCIACAVYRAAAHPETPPLFIGIDGREGCCPGGQAWLGYAEMPDAVAHYISTGSTSVRGGAAEYLKASPEIARESIRAAGAIRAPGASLIIGECGLFDGREEGVRSVICIGPAENIRNLAALAHFGSTNPFQRVIVPWGPSCATLISYPAGLAAYAPAHSAFVGPADPTANRCLPADHLAMGIPLLLARQMATDCAASFLGRRPSVAFPDRHRTEAP
jgi:hypothetical protein